MESEEKTARRQEALHFLNERTNYETFCVIPYQEMAAGFDRFRKTARSLELLTPPFPIIHVAGTKGKGSVALMLERILREEGLVTGLFTSPHLEKVEERFAINGQPVDSDDFTDGILELKKCLDGTSCANTIYNPTYNSAYSIETTCENSANPSPHRRDWTFFEISVLLALLLFRKKGVEAAILETGLGGRFDATNICPSDIAVITSISFDHLELLGSRIEEIAAEKAGIIKPNRPVISGVLAALKFTHFSQTTGSSIPESTELTPERIHAAEKVIQKVAAERNAPLTEITQLSPFIETTPISVLGVHQRYNAEIAWRTLIELAKIRPIPLDESKTARALADLRLPARIEILRRNPTVIVDGAHNRQSAAVLAETLRTVWPNAPRTLIFATTRGKDAAGMLRELVPVFDRIILTDYGTSARALPASELGKIAAETFGALDAFCGAKITVLPESEAIPNALRTDASDSNRLFCCTGSFYFAAGLINKLPL